jgi:hypothetical protein
VGKQEKISAYEKEMINTSTKTIDSNREKKMRREIEKEEFCISSRRTIYRRVLVSRTLLFLSFVESACYK